MTHVSPVQIYQFIRRTLFWVGIVAFPMMTQSSSEIDTLEDGVSKRFNGPKVIVPHSQRISLPLTLRRGYKAKTLPTLFCGWIFFSPQCLYKNGIGFSEWGRELLPGHHFSLELGLLSTKFRTVSGHLCEKLANMDSTLARFVILCYCP